MVRADAADSVRGQVNDAIRSGAKSLVDPSGFPAEREGNAYMAPRILVDVDHTMRVMREETFGPVMTILPVSGDDEAIFDDAGGAIAECIQSSSMDERTDQGLMTEKLRVELRRFFKKRSGRRPLVLPVLMEI